MRASDYRHTIQIQARTDDRDVDNRPVTTWITFATVRAKIVPTSGRERLVADAGRAEVSHIVSIRYQAQFADPLAMAACRVLYGSRILNITSSRDIDERHFDIELTCSEGMNNG
jgi:SPP1 family predicted phage head-tail adaptor